MTNYITAILALGLFAGLLAVTWELKRKNIHIWIFNYLLRKFKLLGSDRSRSKKHIMFCFVDHYEPMWGQASYEDEVKRVDEWVDKYPILAGKHRDADGCYPKHTFFYPEEEYRKEHLDKIVGICKLGYGEIDVHLHHDNDTEEGLREKLARFTGILDSTHKALPIDKDTKKPVFSFIHGNWCLDNSRSDGRWCGVNNELIVLSEMGCYADYTLPSAPSDTQTAKCNSIYYATDDPQKPKSHNHGIDVEVGKKESGDLMIIQGPLGMNWRSRKWGIIPRIENADIRRTAPPTKDRVDLWIKQNIHVKGKPDWIFVKIHTHGTQEGDMDTLLGKPVDDMFGYLETRYNDGENYELHYVSSREMYNIVKAAEHGKTGNPGEYRDYILSPPPMFDQA